jgi:hypothetical protein
MLCNNLVTLRGVEIKQSVDQGSIAQRIYSLSAGLPRSCGVKEDLQSPTSYLTIAGLSLLRGDLKSTSSAIQYYFIINLQIFLQTKRRITNPA